MRSLLLIVSCLYAMFTCAGGDIFPEPGRFRIEIGKTKISELQNIIGDAVSAYEESGKRYRLYQLNAKDYRDCPIKGVNLYERSRQRKF